MKRQLVQAAVVFGFLLAYSATSNSLVADDTAPEKAEKVKQQQYTGSIISISTDDQSVVVQKKEGDKKTFRFADKCNFIDEAKEALSLTDFNTGDKVTCWFREIEDQLQCNRMMRKPANNKSKGAPAAEAVE